MPIEVVLEDDRWAMLDVADLAQQGFNAVMKYFKLEPDIYEVEMLACDDRRIAELNFGFRGIEKTTNVLSWPSVDRRPESEGQFPPNMTHSSVGFLGDIAISYDTCLREVNESERKIEHHVSHLMVHAVLHLLGFDHENDKDAVLMETIEVEILGKMGFDNPYN
jgi:probable rRNA maturation factor